MKKSWVTYLIMFSASYLLTRTTVLLGAPFIRVMYRRYGPKIFWPTGIIFSAAMGPLWFMGASIWLTIGVFSELESRGTRWLWSGLLSLTLGSAAFIAGAYRALSMQGISTLVELAEAVKTFFSERVQWTLPAEFNFENLIYQAPSIAVILLIVVLAHGLIFERLVCSWFRMAYERYASQVRLLQFKLPDAFVWTTMLAFLGSLFESQAQWVFINVLNVCVALFFFQGLAILEFYFKALRVGILLRALGYFLFVFQLFVVLAFVGFIDFWVDFRSRFRKAPANEDNKNARIL